MASALISCATTCELDELRREFNDKIERRVMEVSNLNVFALASLTLCNTDINRLLIDVTQGCTREDVCLDEKIKTILRNIYPGLENNLIPYFSNSTFPHEFVYFGPNDNVISALRLDRLRSLASLPHIETTTYLVISLVQDRPKRPTELRSGDPQVSRAEQRGLRVIEILIDSKIPRSMIPHWVLGQPYGNYFSAEHLRAIDKPLKEYGEWKKAENLVMVVRLDCNFKK